MDIEGEFKNLPTIQRFFWRLIIGLIGVVLASLFIVLVMYGVYFLVELIGGNRTRLRIPVFVFFLPIIGFFVGFKQAEIYQPFFSLLYRYSIYFRLFVFGSLFYIAATFLFIELFEPSVFRRGLNFVGGFNLKRQFGLFLKILLFPPTMFGVGLFFLSKVKPKN